MIATIILNYYTPHDNRPCTRTYRDDPVIILYYICAQPDYASVFTLAGCLKQPKNDDFLMSQYYSVFVLIPSSILYYLHPAGLCQRYTLAGCLKQPKNRKFYISQYYSVFVIIPSSISYYLCPDGLCQRYTLAGCLKQPKNRNLPKRGYMCS